MALLGGKKADMSDPKAVWEEFFRAAMKNDWNKSLGFLDALKKHEPKNPQVFMKTGDILQRLGKADDSVAAYRKAAGLLQEGEEYTKALAIFKIILRLVPGDPDATERSKALMDRMSSAAPPQDAEPQAEDEGGIEAAGGGEAPEQAPEPEARPAPGPAPAAAQAAPPPKARPRDLREAFAQHPVFSVLTDDEIKFMSSEARHLSFNPGDVVIEEDTQGDSIYVIKKGRAGVTTSVVGRTLKLASLGGLAFFGEGGFLTGSPRTATVTAAAPLEVMEIPKSLMSELIIRNPKVLGRLMEILRARASKAPKGQAGQ